MNHVLAELLLYSSISVHTKLLVIALFCNMWRLFYLSLHYFATCDDCFTCHCIILQHVTTVLLVIALFCNMCRLFYLSLHYFATCDDCFTCHCIILQHVTTVLLVIALFCNMWRLFYLSLHYFATCDSLRRLQAVKGTCLRHDIYPRSSLLCSLRPVLLSPRLRASEFFHLFLGLHPSGMPLSAIHVTACHMTCPPQHLSMDQYCDPCSTALLVPCNAVLCCVSSFFWSNTDTILKYFQSLGQSPCFWHTRHHCTPLVLSLVMPIYLTTNH